MILFTLLLSITSFASPVSIFLNDVDQFLAADKLLKVESEKSKSAGLYSLSKKMLWTPTISAGFVKSNQRLNNELSDVSKSFSLNGNWNLFRGGSDYYSVLAGNAAQESQNFQELSQTNQVEGKASEIIFKRLFLMSSYQANSEQKKLKEAAMGIARERFRSGRISQQELDKIEIDYSQQLNRMRQIEIEKIDLEQKIKSSFIQAISTDSWPLTEQKVSSFNFGNKSNESQKVYWSAQSRKYGWRSAKLKHLPSLDLSFDYRRFEKPRDPESELPIVKSQLNGYYGGDKSWSTTLTLTIPIWSQLQTTADASSEYVNYQETQANFDNLESEEVTKREALQKKLGILSESVSESKKVLQKTESLYQATLRGFQFGKVSANDLFMEQGRLIDTRLEYSQNQLAFHTAVIEACNLTGSSLRDCLASAR